MNAILQGLAGIFEIVLILAVGYFFGKKGWFWKDADRDLTKFTMTIGLPPFMIYSMCSRFDRDALISMAPDLVLPFLSIFVAWLAGYVLAKILHIRRSRIGVFVTSCCIANAIFIGLPVNMALFGEESVPAVMLYYVANTTMFWTLGAFLIIKDAGSTQSFTPKEMASKFASPPLMGFVLSLILIMLGISIPKPIMDACRYVGGIATPTALIVIGLQVSHMPFSSFRWDRELLGACLGRFILAPLCLMALLPFIPVTPLSADVFFMQAGMPAMSNMTLLAKSVGADSEYATEINCVTIVMGVFFIPLYMYLIG